MLTVPARTLEKYLRRNPPRRPLEPVPPSPKFDRAVVIPACAEAERLPATLASLAANPPEELARTLVAVVINHHPAAEPEKKADNRRCLQALRQGECRPAPPHLVLIDAASDGREISREGGVGEARRIGLDAVLPHLDLNADPLLFCLDADTVVEPDYLAAGRRAFDAAPDAAAGVFRFRHQPGANPAEEAAIREYEHYLDSYVAGLRRAGSPYAYHAMGSAIVCRAAANVLCGGMKIRNAGEDFYFLQALRKIGPVIAIDTSAVHPSARISDRVPFGTGRRILRITGGEPAECYPDRVFDRLTAVLAAVADTPPDALPALSERLENQLPPDALAYFHEQHFAAAWTGIIANTPPLPEKLRQAFHTWFDAFRTLKFIHFLMQPSR